MRDQIHSLITSLIPFDPQETLHRQFALHWIESGAELFRIKKPDTPHTHLVAYAVFIADGKILLTDHKRSGLWLPPGGHVEPGEHPQNAVQREAFEELSVKADFLLPDPLFLTVTKTVQETPGHTDVSLWYILKGNTSDVFHFDQTEFTQIRWFSLEEIPAKTDPHMSRFVQKLSSFEEPPYKWKGFFEDLRNRPIASLPNPPLKG